MNQQKMGMAVLMSISADVTQVVSANFSPDFGWCLIWKSTLQSKSQMP